VVVVTLAVLLGGFVALAWTARVSPVLAAWDQQTTDGLVGWRTPGWSRVFWSFTLLFGGPVMAAIVSCVVLLLALWGRRTWAIVIAGGVLLAWGISYLAKELVHRPRPWVAIALIKEPGSRSLPSAHAVLSLVFCGFIAYLAFRHIDARRVRAAASGDGAGGAGRGGCGGAAIRAHGKSDLFTAAVKAAVVVVGAAVVALVGASRVYLGVHWGSDVLAGWCLGGVFLVTMLSISVGWEPSGRVWGVFRDTRPCGRKGVRVALVALFVLIVVIVALVAARANPLLSGGGEPALLSGLSTTIW
jgi:membrane-associated phospholipid phosphatase